MKEWYFNEVAHAGVSYSEETIAEEYDSNHKTFRDYDEEVREIVELMGISGEQDLIDLGAGTGALTLGLAKGAKSVHAVDISKEMLAQLKRKARLEKIENITTENAGFLTFNCEEKYDRAVSSMALHHLSDFWKQLAVKRIADSLKPGGRFFLVDVVYDFPFGEYEEHLDALVKNLAEMNTLMGEEAVIHIRDELSTFSWIMEKILTDAGFVIDQKITHDGVVVKYCCTKSREGK